MNAPAATGNEAERLRALEECAILDSPREPEFDRLTELAARVFDVPIALITLIDSRRQWFKSSVGVELRETSRRISFCAHTILHADTLVVEDARTDPRFADNPMVLGGMGIRFYAGAPLVTDDGLPLGALCVKDRRPREFSERDRELLAGLAGQVTALLEHRRHMVTLEREAASLRVAAHEAAAARERYWEIFHAAPDAVVVIDEEGSIAEFNPAAERLFGREREEMLRERAADTLFPSSYRERFEQALAAAAAGGRPVEQHGHAKLADGQVIPVELRLALARRRPIQLVASLRSG